MGSFGVKLPPPCWFLLDVFYERSWFEASALLWAAALVQPGLDDTDLCDVETWFLVPGDVISYCDRRVPLSHVVYLFQKQTEPNVRNKILYLIQAWAHAFRNEPKYKVVQDTYQIMKVEGLWNK